MSDPFKKPEVKEVQTTPAGVTPEEESDKELKKRKRRLQQSREAFEARTASLGPIQLQAPSLGGI